MAAQGRAEQLAKAGDIPAALREVDSALKQSPNDSELHSLRGLFLARQGNLQQAKDAFERALTLGSPRAETLERLGALLDELGDRRAARARFGQAIAIEPDRPGPRLSLAVLDLADGRPREAIRRLEGITGGWPGAPQAQFYLGEAKRSLGDIEGARQAYRACLELAQHADPIRERAQHRLADLK